MDPLALKVPDEWVAMWAAVWVEAWAAVWAVEWGKEWVELSAGALAELWRAV